MRRILLFGAFLYFFLAPLTYHNDNKLVLFWASQNEGKVWDIWKWGETNLPPTKQFNYPPLHFYLAKLQYTIAAPLGGEGFTQWLSSSDPTDPQNPSLPRYMLASKFVLILFGLLTGYLLYLLAKEHGVSEKRSRVAAILWLFNPVTLYSLPMMGQNDVMAIAFFLCGWLMIRKYPKASGILFGLGASIKTYPLLWLAFLLPTLPKISIKSKAFIFISSIVVYGATLVPFLHNPIFKAIVLNSDINDRFLISQISIGFEQAINLVPLLIGILFFFIIRKKNEFSFSQQAAVVMTANLVLLGFTHFHPQWYTWVMPFWALWLSQLKTTKQLSWAILLSLGAIVSWMAAIFLFQDKYLTFGMISILNPSLFNLPVFYEFLVLHGVNVGKFDNLAHTGLAGVSVLALLSLCLPSSSSPEDAVFHFPKISLRIPKVVRFIGVAGLILTMTFLGTLVLQRVPVPQSSRAVEIATFVPLQNQIQVQVTGEQPNLTRFDLLLRNPQLENKGSFEIAIYDAEIRTLMLSQKISGRNVGDYTTLRFDLPAVQLDSVGKTYEFTITPMEGTQSAILKDGSLPKSDEGYVLIGKTGEGEKEIAITTYYASDLSFRSVISRSISKLSSIFSQIWVYAVIVFVLLFLAI